LLSSSDGGAGLAQTMVKRQTNRRRRNVVGNKGLLLGAEPSLPRDLRRAIDHFRANLHRSVPLSELAAQVGVSERTLRDHFQRFLALSPSSYGLRLRLNAVRRELQRPLGSGSIAEAALRYGFSHMGRFSQQYRRLFEEAPSTTRRGLAPWTGSEAEIVAPAPRGDRPEIAILPFQAPASLSELARLLADSISAGLAGDVVVRLVLPPGPGRLRDIRARYLIRGQFVQGGDRFRAVLSLVDAVDGQHLWGDAWEGPMLRPFSTLDRVVTAVVGMVLANIRKAEIARATAMRPGDLEAYQLCLRAFPLLAANTPPNARRALDLLNRALERDPDYGVAAAFAAWGHAQLVTQLGSTDPAKDRAEALLLSDRAAMLDRDEPTALTARSVAHTMASQHDRAGELVARALARNPRLAWAWERSGWLAAFSGDMNKVLTCFGRSLRLDPASPGKVLRFAGIAAGFFDAGRYDLATQWMRRAIEAEPGAIWINRTLAVSYARIGELGLARQSLAALRRYRPDIRVRDVVSALPFPPDFLARLANGLSDLGLPP
jgi:AraC-like DNA-binding protein/tetratricopeptide (TPR) repeat protein